ncbi:transcriptional regulator, PadR-like family [Gluconacetobacter diazotrophicus PA1 5]|uniref:PadR family transcriptional regulator n=1 Tax=Gluconacetobacter diazotrophicus TaxID=33996 RepID=A0A7W4I5H8_GLUDI|nr:PadR family transcriptional regulator [Gluconacetobacter diazotrophicus]ACI50910.1 transcriptional regulator, PadR-like family [Gluconacetobacter diazotrophicus PA1 5]MBB2156155.1 PadR family transcriptional regulator [Gluconacetobacter diazotrophicus]TWB08635.1 PadR family transcriptional regulator [Gluconacetobacter diazotrophicus]
MFRDHHPTHRLHHILHAIGRRHGRHGFGRGFGGGFGRGFGGGDFPAGRKFSSEELQLVLLSLLADRPAHGYELIRLLEEKSGGFYAPSPGMVYPALTYLEEIGHATVTPEGNRKLYTLTDEGRAYLEANRGHADAILDMLARIGGRMAEVRDAFAGVDAPDPQAADDLHRARHAIKQALMRKRGCAPDEARRIARILDRAAAEILGSSD